MNQQEYKELLMQSRRFLETRQSECDLKYGLNQFRRMEYEQETGKMIFSNEGELTKVVAVFQIVGSLSGSSKTWLWSWDNPYLLENTTKDMHEVKDFGSKNDIDKLTIPKWDATEEDAWDMTAITAKLLKAGGAYSFLSDDIRVFVVFKDLKVIGKFQ
jgi:hypothetical protein